MGSPSGLFLFRLQFTGAKTEQTIQGGKTRENWSFSHICGLVTGGKQGGSSNSAKSRIIQAIKKASVKLARGGCCHKGTIRIPAKHSAVNSYE